MNLFNITKELRKTKDIKVIWLEDTFSKSQEEVLTFKTLKDFNKEIKKRGFERLSKHEEKEIEKEKNIFVKKNPFLEDVYDRKKLIFNTNKNKLLFKYRQLIDDI